MQTSVTKRAIPRRSVTSLAPTYASAIPHRLRPSERFLHGIDPDDVVDTADDVVDTEMDDEWNSHGRDDAVMDKCP